MKKKSLGGRPRKREREAGEKVHLGIRVTPDMKRRLEEVAHYNGRSQTQEAELRLERSFAREDLLVDALYLRYSREAAGVVLAVGEIMNTVGVVHLSLSRKPEDPTFYDEFDLAERRWAAHPTALDVGLTAGIALLAMLRPGPPQEEAGSVTATYRRLAIETAAGFLQALAKGPHKDEPAFFRQKRETICSLLGPMIVEQIKHRSSSVFEELEQVFRAPSARQPKEKVKTP
jgi:hypothetical protein